MRLHPRRQPDRGQALVEFALVFPIFLLIVFGIVDAGRLIFAYNALSNAAREGARVAVVNQAATGTNTCNTDSTAFAVGCAISAAPVLGLTPADVTVTYRNSADSGGCSPVSIGCIAVVTTSGQFRALTPGISLLIPSLTLTSTTKMPVERVCSSNC